MTATSTLRARLLLGLGLTALALTLAAAPAAAGAAHAANLPRAAGSAGTCSLPLTRDHYMGYHIGVPAGWELSTFNGTIEVARDLSGTEMALVYPALLTGGLTPASFFAAYSKILQQTATAAGNAISFHLTSRPGQLPRADITGRVGKVAEQGRAEVLLVHRQTALAAYQVVYSVYWAPPARSAADGAMLASIGRCYGPESGTLYQKYQDQVFALALPEGWQIADEGQDTIDIVGDAQRAMASYALMLVPASAGATTPRLLLEYAFGQMHIQIDHILSSTDVPTQQAGDGSVTGQEYVEFTGRYAGKAIHGLVSVYCIAGPTVTSGVMRLGMTTADQWNAVNSGLTHVMISIQHSFQQDQAQIDHLNQQQQQNDQTQQQFDNVIRGVQDVQDPTTGTVYEAPYDSYLQSGPDGPGYYRDDNGTLQRLQPVNHQ